MTDLAVTAEYVGSSQLDALVFGQRLRHVRQQRGLTLSELGERVGRRAPYLSRLENGKREPTLSLIGALADVLGVTPGDLLDPTPPTRRAELEVALERAQDDPLYRRLGLNLFPLSRRVDDDVLEHVIALYGELRRVSSVRAQTPEEARKHNAQLRALLASGFDDLAAVPTSAEIWAEAGNPSAALLGGWLTSRLGIKVKRTTSDGPGITAVEVRFEGRSRLRIDRPDGYLATLSRTGMADRQLPLKRRELGELIAEELKRLDADQPYADALSAATGAKDLDSRPAQREHIWRDPMERPARRATKKAPAAQKSTARKPAAKKATRKAGR
jgi:transcriptional regulator with XRE-family HTH domain